MSEYVMVPRGMLNALIEDIRLTAKDWTDRGVSGNAVLRAYLTDAEAMLAAAPTPPSGEAVAEALSAAVSAIYFDDSSDYLRALWSVVRAIDPAMADLLDRSPYQAYDAANRAAAAPREPAPVVKGGK